VNVLSYFETLCTDTAAANVLVNSSLAILFIRMLRNSRAPQLRCRLASVLGLLVRHATFIADELAATGVVDTLVDALKDRNERVRWARVG
jgi:serine/threonine-protein kinase ULK4